MGPKFRTAAAICAAAVLFGGTPAAAHEAGLGYRSVVQRLSENIDGLEVAVKPSIAPFVELRNRTGETVVVLGEKGEPFVRMRQGRVEVNRNAPTAYRAVDPFGGRPVPEAADPRAPADWDLVAEGDTYRWFDPRIRPEQGALVTEVEPGVWSIPLRVGELGVDVVGRIEPISEHGHFRAVLTEHPRADELEVRILDGTVPAYFVRNRTGKVLEVPGLAGEPFLRIGPDGVEGNTRSPCFYRADPNRIRDVPPEADANAEPVWEKLADAPVWGWLEYRARARTGEVPAEVGDEPQTVLEWTTQTTFGGEPAPIAGLVEWAPVGSVGRASERPWVLIGVSVVVLLVGAVVTWTRVRRRSADA